MLLELNFSFKVCKRSIPYQTLILCHPIDTSHKRGVDYCLLQENSPQKKPTAVSLSLSLSRFSLSLSLSAVLNKYAFKM